MSTSVVKVFVIGCLSSLEDIQTHTRTRTHIYTHTHTYIIRSLQLIWLFGLSHSFVFFWLHFVSLYIRLCALCASVNFVNYVFLLLCMFRSVYSVAFCSVYCLCVNVYCTTATGCQPNCS